MIARSFLLSRLHILSGLLFAAGFVVGVLVPYSAVFSGPAAFDAWMTLLGMIPLRSIFIGLFFILPTLFYFVMEIHAIVHTEFTVVRFGCASNWFLTVERLVMVLVIPFVLYHLFMTHFSARSSAALPTFALMKTIVGSGWMRGVYMAGVAAVSLHIGLFLPQALFRLGIIARQKTVTRAAMMGWVLVLLLALWGILLVLRF